MKRRHISKIICVILAGSALAYGVAWTPVMLGIADAMRQSTQPAPYYTPPTGAEQRFTAIMLLSLIPLILLIFFAVVLGRAGFRAQSGESVSLRGAYWTVGLFLLSAPVGLLALGAVIPAGIFQVFINLWQSLVSHLPSSLTTSVGRIDNYAVFILDPVFAFFALLIGGISWGRAVGTRSQRAWQYLARVAFLFSSGILVLVFFVIALVLLFIFHPLHLVF